MKVTLKLYASLGIYLPDGAQKNQADVAVDDGTTVRGLLDSYNVPPAACHLVLLNGVFQTPAARIGMQLKPGDAVAVWPPVAGG
jgi:molybdopterin converting factor small subunit